MNNTPQTMTAVKDETCPECGHPEMYMELNTETLTKKGVAGATRALGCRKCGLYRTDVARFIVETNLIASLRAEDGCGSDLNVGDRDGEWLFDLDGNLDIEHLASDVLALAYALSTHYPDQLHSDLDAHGQIIQDSGGGE